MRILLALLFTILIIPVYAQNLAQMTGGNYIYARNGQLTFNLEPGLFANRTWAFDNKKDSARTEFTTNLPLKTKHASQFHGHEIAALEAMNMRVVVTGGSNFAMLMRPVYSYGKQGRYVKAWLPTAAGWLVRVGGIIARNVLPPIITNVLARCVQNYQFCASLFGGVGITLAKLCAINYSGKGIISRIFHLPAGICEQAEEAGFKKDPETGQYTKKQPYKVTVIHGRKDTPDYKEEVFGAESEAQAMNMLRAKCNSMVGQHYEGTDLNDWSNYGLEGKIVRAEFFEAPIVCRTTANDGEDFRGPSWTAQIEKTGYVETLTMVDIANFASKDFAKNPNPYINDKGQVGKELREKILPYAYVHKGGLGGSDNSGSRNEGKFTASSNVYIDPKTGNAVQDVVTVSAVNKPSNPDLPSTGSVSGSGGAGGSGNSDSLNESGNSGGLNNSNVNSTNNAAATGSTGGVTNSVTVITNPRPDRQHDATAAESNLPNGKGSGSGSGNGDASGSGAGGDASGAGGGEFCEKNKNTVACAEMGEMDEQFFDDIEVPRVSNDTQWSADLFLPTNGSCPAPKTFNVWGRPFQVSYEPLCELVRKIRFIVLIAFLIMSAKIVFSGLKGN